MSILSKLQNKNLGIFEILAMGYSLYFNNFRAFAILVCILLPFSIITDILAGYASINPSLLILTAILSIFFGLFVVTIYTPAIAILVEDIVLNKETRVNVALKQVVNRAFPLVKLNIRFFINLYLRIFLFIIPGIIYSVNNIFYYVTYILRDQRGKSAFKYSSSLVKGNWWKVFFFSLLVSLNAFGALFFFHQIVSIFIPNYPIIVSIISSILTFFFGVGIVISTVLLFLNLDFQKR